MNQTQLKRLDDTVMGWLSEVRVTILRRMTQCMQVSTKSSQRDLVTNIDREVEQYYVSAIRHFDQSAKILGEEGFGDRVTNLTGRVWFVDPIDGTMNFIKQRSEFASMLALYEDGKPVMAWIMDVMNNRVIHGGPNWGVYLNDLVLDQPDNLALTEGLMILSGARLLYEQHKYPEIARAALGYRVYGSAGISFMHVLQGKCVGYSSQMKPWDYAAGLLLGEALGLTVGTIDGSPIDVLSSGTVLVATELAYNNIMAIEHNL